jgi:thiol:disulfide interchange protein DsbD
MKRLLLAALLGSGAALAQKPPAEPSLTAKLAVDADRLVAGKPFRLAVVAEVKPGWHVNSHTPKEDYLIPTSVAVAPAPGLKVEAPAYPKHVERKFSFSEQPVAVYEGKAVVTLAGTVDAAAAPGPRTLVATVSYQACNDTQCMPPAKAEARATIDVAAAGTASKPANGDLFGGGTPSAKPGSPRADAGSGPSDPSGPVTPAALRERWDVKGVPTLIFLGADGVEKGSRVVGYEPPAQFLGRLSATAPAAKAAGLAGKSLPLLLAIVFVSGLALNLTPCVYPLIPITMSFFAKQDGGGGKGRTFALALSYVLGMSVTYSALGVFAALSGSLFGAWLQKPVVLVGVAAIILALALSMFGLFEIQAPHAITDRSGSKSGVLGAATMGLFVGFVAAPCIGPFVLSLLTFVASTGSPAAGFGLFFTLAMGLGLPYLVLGTASASLRKLPRSGEWMVAVKKVFGFALLALAVWFLRPLLPERVFTAAIAVPLLVGGLYLLVFEKSGRALGWFRALKVAAAMIFLAAGAVFALPQGAKKAKDLHFQPYTEEAVAAARAAGKPVIIDIFADRCLPCKELGKSTFTDAKVVAALDGWVLLKADLTRE